MPVLHAHQIFYAFRICWPCAWSTPNGCKEFRRAVAVGHRDHCLWDVVFSRVRDRSKIFLLTAPPSTRLWYVRRLLHAEEALDMITLFCSCCAGSMDSAFCRFVLEVQLGLIQSVIHQKAVVRGTTELRVDKR
eukprot:6269597-Karenia_brevis.AAC.1